jgi:hypothetical protein
VSWTISTCDGEVLLGGGAPFDGCAAIGGDYLIDMYDSFGDGWNGNTITVDGVVYGEDFTDGTEMTVGTCAIYDDCGVLDGDGTSCLDCCGVMDDPATTVNEADNSSCYGDGHLSLGSTDDGYTCESDVGNIVALANLIVTETAGVYVTTTTDGVTTHNCAYNDVDINNDGMISVLDIIVLVNNILDNAVTGDYTDDPETSTYEGYCVGCDEGTVEDCAGDGDCIPETWIGDGLCDGEDQAWGGDLTCYDNDGGDCDEPDEPDTTEACDDCEFDWTNYGAECCETAFDEFGIDCITLETNYGWDCTGCACENDVTCEDQGLVTCEFGTVDGAACAADESGCLGDGECAAGNVNDCVDGDCCPESWIGDGWADCEDQAFGCDLTCYDNDGGDCDVAASCGADEFDCLGDGTECIPASWECDIDWVDCSNGADEADCDGEEEEEEEGSTCEAGSVEDCSGDGDCAPESWIGDGWCDGTDQPWGYDLTCYDNDGGDCP